MINENNMEDVIADIIQDLDSGELEKEGALAKPKYAKKLALIMAVVKARMKGVVTERTVLKELEKARKMARKMRGSAF